MTGDTGKNESRKLENGEMFHLFKPPAAKWRIRFMPCWRLTSLALPHYCARHVRAERH